MTMIAFTIPGEPTAFARAGGGKSTVRFTPAKQRNFMQLVRLAAGEAMRGQEVMGGPVSLMVRASYLIPKSWSKKKVAGAIWRTARPDADNLAKIIADAMNTIVYGDDAQVASLTVQKVYGPIAGVTVTVVCLDDNSTISDASDRGGAVEAA